MFEIIATANADLLEQILVGVAMLTVTGTGSEFGGMVAVGALIGLVMAGARALVTQRLELQWLLVGWMMYAAMFVPKVDVTIEDMETGGLDVVSDVPIGIAAIGTLASQVGRGLAESFNTIFTPPGSGLVTGYGDALNVLAALRDPDYGDANDAAAGVAANVDVQRSISRYLKDCVLYAIAVEDSPLSLTWEQLRNSPDLLSEINVPAVAWYTVTYLDTANPDGTTQTCQAAYAALAGVLRGTFQQEWFAYLGSKTGVANMQDEVDDAMDYLFGITGQAQNFMLNALLAKELQLADLDYQAAAGNTAGVLMRTQAIEQRRVQWATEKSLFEEVARPLMGYVEAFFYAVSPVMAFLFVLGQFGVMLFGRYLLLAAWIQLWMPIMAVNNLYIHHAAEQSFEAFQASGVNLLTMTGMESVWTETASWVAVGGMMAAATPLLALMLLTGSYFAMTQLTNRMSGRDFTNEQIMAPALVQPAAVSSAGTLFEQEGRYVTGAVHGTRLRHGENAAPQIEWENEARAAASETRESVASRTQSYQNVASASASRNLNSTERVSDAIDYVHSNSANHTQLDSAQMQEANKIAEKHLDLSRLSNQEKEFMSGVIGLGISTGSLEKVFKAAPDVGVRFQAGVEKSRMNEESSTDEVMSSIERATSETMSSSASIQEAIGTSDRAVQDSVFAEAMGVNRETRFTETAQGLEQASQKLSEVQSRQSEIGVEQDMSAVTFGQMFEQHRSDLWAAAVNAGIPESAVNHEAGVMHRRYGMPNDQAYTAALGVLLTQADPGAAYEVLATGRGVETDMPTPGAPLAESLTPVDRPADAPTVGVGTTIDEMEGGITAGMATAGAPLAGREQAPRQAFERWTQQVEDDAAGFRLAGLEAGDQARTEQLLNTYGKDNPPGKHPMRDMGTYWGAARPLSGAQQDEVLEGLRGDAAAAGVVDSGLQDHYARLAAQEMFGVQYPPDEQPSREELVGEHTHGEEVVGYVENAATTHDVPPAEYLRAAAHLMDHPLEEQGPGAGTASGGAARSPSVPSSGPAAAPAAAPSGGDPGGTSEGDAPAGGVGPRPAEAVEVEAPGGPSMSRDGPAMGAVAQGGGPAAPAAARAGGDPGGASEGGAPAGGVSPRAAEPVEMEAPGGPSMSRDGPAMGAVAPGGGSAAPTGGDPHGAPDGGGGPRAAESIDVPAGPSLGGDAPAVDLAPSRTSPDDPPDVAPPTERPESGPAVSGDSGAVAGQAAPAAATLARAAPAGGGMAGAHGATAQAGSSLAGAPESGDPTSTEPVDVAVPTGTALGEDGRGYEPESVEAAPSAMGAASQSAPSAAQTAAESPQEVAERLYAEGVNMGVPTHTAWVVAQEAAGLETSGPEYERHQEGMQAEIGANSETQSLVDTAVASGADGDGNAFGAAMEELAVTVRDGEPTGQPTKRAN